jgi:hypothetical protein
MPIIVAGAAEDWDKDLFIKLKDAVETAWPSMVTALPDTPPSFDGSGNPYIYFLSAWPRLYGDIAFSFIQSITLPTSRSLGWHHSRMVSWVDVHLMIQGISRDEAPDVSWKVKRAFQHLIKLNATTLIPNAIVSIDRCDYIPNEEDNDLVWHWVYAIPIVYSEIRT